LLETPYSSQLPVPFSFEGSICPYISRLSITLSLPLPFFQAIAASPSSDQDRAPSNLEDDLSTWSHIASRLLIQLPRLRKLHIWLDHNGKEYWSVVNERAILAPIEALKTSNPGLKLVCVLPKVHPRIEDRQRHYLGDEDNTGNSEESSSRLEIHRILRQRYRVVERSTGYKYVIYAQDFPHILDNPLCDCMSLAEKEEFEGTMWRAGENVDQFFSGFI
jgi:hypothetical protein